MFWDYPIQEHITAKGASIQSLAGISVIVPEGALSDGEEIDLLIHPCINGSFILPPPYVSASPAYLIRPSKKVKFQKNATIQIHHYTKLSIEDCGKMAFFSASPTPIKTFYAFHKIQQAEGFFSPNNQVAEISMKHFCLITIGRVSEEPDRRWMEPSEGNFRQKNGEKRDLWNGSKD